MVRRRLDRRELLLGGGFVLLLLAVLTLYVWYQTEAVRLGYEIAAERERVAALREEIRSLEARKAALLSLRGVERTARERLGLSDPRPDQVVTEGRPAAAPEGR